MDYLSASLCGRWYTVRSSSSCTHGVAITFTHNIIGYISSLVRKFHSTGRQNTNTYNNHEKLFVGYFRSECFLYVRAEDPEEFLLFGW